MAPSIRMAWITGDIGGSMDTRAGTRISTYDGDVEIPRADPDLLVYDEDVVKLRSKAQKKKARAIKWAKIRKAIKALLHKIKEKLKE